MFDRSEIWQAPRQQYCRGACQISKRYDNSSHKSRGFETISSDKTSYRILRWVFPFVGLIRNMLLNKESRCQWCIMGHHCDVANVVPKSPESLIFLVFGVFILRLNAIFSRCWSRATVSNSSGHGSLLLAISLFTWHRPWRRLPATQASLTPDLRSLTTKQPDIR